MNKRLILFIIILALFVPLVLFVFFLEVSNSGRTAPGIIATPTPITIPGVKNPGSINTTPTSLLVTNIDPANKSTNIPLDKAPVLTFNKVITISDITITIKPNTPFTEDTVNNQLIINFNNHLPPQTIYTITESNKTQKIPQVFTFTTGDAPSTDQTANSNAQGNLQNNPDMFLFSQMPYNTNEIAAYGEFTSTPTGHYFFTVSLLGTNQQQDKQDFITWMKSLGLSDQQIQKLDIRYQ